jgi:predicted transcriptional regulator
MDKVIVRFLRGNGYYVKGNITQVSQEEADKLLKSKHIEIIKPDSQEFEAPKTALSNLPSIPEDKFICPICGKEFDNEKSLKMHKLAAHKIR